MVDTENRRGFALMSTLHDLSVHDGPKDAMLGKPQLLCMQQSSHRSFWDKCWWECDYSWYQWNSMKTSRTSSASEKIRDCIHFRYKIYHEDPLWTGKAGRSCIRALVQNSQWLPTALCVPNLVSQRYGPICFGAMTLTILPEQVKHFTNWPALWIHAYWYLYITFVTWSRVGLLYHDIPMIYPYWWSSIHQLPGFHQNLYRFQELAPDQDGRTGKIHLRMDDLGVALWLRNPWCDICIIWETP